MNSVPWTYIIFRHFHVLNWHILGRFWITIINYKLKIKNQKKIQEKNFQIFQIFKIGLKLSQISQFAEKYLKIGIFFTLRKKISKRKTKKFLKFSKLENGLKRSWICQFVEKYQNIQVRNNFERPKLHNRMKLIYTAIFA